MKTILLTIAALFLALAGPTAGEEYDTHMPCRGVTYRGAFKVIGPCLAEIEAGGYLVVYFKSDAPVEAVPALILRAYAPGSYIPAPQGVTIELTRLYPVGEAAGQTNNIKATIKNMRDEEVYVTVEAWLPR